MDGTQSQDGDTVTLTETILAQGSTSESGAWNYAQFAILGVPTPPPKGWKLLVLGKTYPAGTIRDFLAASNRAREEPKPITRKQLVEHLSLWFSDGFAREVVGRLWERME